MEKKYVVRLSDEERAALAGIIKTLKGSSQKVKRAQILLKADADGPNWTDAKIADSFSCRTQTVEGIRQRLLTALGPLFVGSSFVTPPNTVAG